MNHKMSLLISIVCVLLAFILGYVYAYREYILSVQRENATLEYVDITSSTRNITIKNAPENIRFRVNGELIMTGSIDLK